MLSREIGKKFDERNQMRENSTVLLEARTVAWEFGAGKRSINYPVTRLQPGIEKGSTGEYLLQDYNSAHSSGMPQLLPKNMRENTRLRNRQDFAMYVGTQIGS